MKKLGKLSISSEKIMKNEKLINLQGGYAGGGGCQQYFCQCTGTLGTWIGNYCSTQEAKAAIAYWCVNGTGGWCDPV